MICYLPPSELTIDHSIQPRDGLDKDTVDKYVAAIEAARDWPFPPVKAFEDGVEVWLSDGFHRIEALSKARQIAGLENLTATVDVEPGTRRDAALYAMAANLKHGLPLKYAERKASAVRLLADPEWSSWSNYKLAEISGISEATVRSLRNLRSDTDGNDQLRLYERGGQILTMNTSAIGQRHNDGDDNDAARSGAHGAAPMDTGCADMAPSAATGARREGDDPVARGVAADEHNIEAGAVIVQTTTATTALDRIRRDGHQPSVREQVLSSKEVRWFTPNFPAEPARRVMGGIELDPASCEEANARIGAERIFTEDDDGLSQPWSARSLWLNPPYGGETPKWVNKLIEHYRTDDIGQAMALLNAVPHRRWFQRMWSISAAVCFLNDMIRFHAPGGEQGAQPTYGNALFYLTTGSIAGFVEAFAPHGRIVATQSAAAQITRRDPAMKILIEGAAP